jgi:uncharacterized protein YukE
MTTSIEETLENMDINMKKLKSHVEKAASAGDMQDAEKWIGGMNALIRGLDHLVETLENTDK